VQFAVTVGAENSAFSGFDEDAFFAPIELPDGVVDRDFLLPGILVVEFKTSRMILATKRTLE